MFSRNRVILEAEAESESVRVRGEAEAFAIEAKAKAEAEQMAKKADAWKDYQDAAMIDMILETLPKVCWIFFYSCELLHHFYYRFCLYSVLTCWVKKFRRWCYFI